MSLNPDIPKIAITPGSEEDDDNVFDLTETLTDLEAIDEEESPTTNTKQKIARKNKLKIKLTDDIYTTDYEDYEASDNEEDIKLIKHKSPISLENMDLEEGTYEESFKDQGMPGKGKNKLRTQRSITQMKKEPLEESNDALTNPTDEESFNTDSELESKEITTANMNLEYYNDDVNVSEIIKFNHENTSSDIPDNNLNVNQLSTLSLSPNLSDLTDVEVLYSDLNDETDTVKDKSRRRRRRGGRKYSETDVEDLEISESEVGCFTQNKKSSKRQTRANLMAKSQSLNFESDNEDNGNVRFPICKKVTKRSMLKIPNFETNLLTDTEDVEGEVDDQSPLLENELSSDNSLVEKLSDIVNCYSQTTEINTMVKNKRIYKQALNKDKNKQAPNKDTASSKHQSTESDNYQSEDDASDQGNRRKSINYKICFSPKPKTSVLRKSKKNVKGENITDSEAIDSSSDENGSETMPLALLNQNFTEEEDFEDDEIDSTYQFPEIELPLPSRNLVVLKENNPQPSVHILPLEDDAPEKIQLQDLPKVQTDEESISEAEDALETLGTIATPELPSLDFGFVQIIDTLGQKLKITAVDNGAVTDTEDLILDGKVKHRRAPKFKYLHEKSLARRNKLLVNEERALLTDTEDVYLSDDNVEQTNHLIPRQANDVVTDVENLVGSSEEDKDAGVRPLSCTPQHMREMGCETVMAKEGAGPFSKEDRISVNLYKKGITQVTVSPTNTDTEDMVASADEDNANYSRAETATPNQVHSEFDGMSSSKVYAAVVNKFDADAPNEVMYLKGGGYTERNTDVEDISDMEHEFATGVVDLEDYMTNGNNETVSLNFHDGFVSFGIGKEWDAQKKPAMSEPKALIEDAAQQGEEATTSVVREPPPVRAEGEEADKEEGGSERKIADQHQLSEEMKQLLKELEKESKQ